GRRIERQADRISELSELHSEAAGAGHELRELWFQIEEEDRVRVRLQHGGQRRRLVAMRAGRAGLQVKAGMKAVPPGKIRHGLGDAGAAVGKGLDSMLHR